MIKTRFDCDIAGFEACYVEFSPRWTRAEVRAFWGDGEGQTTLDLMQRKIVRLHVELVDLPALTDPTTINNDALDDMDWELFQWLNSALIVFVQEMARLGEVTRRRLSATTAPTTAGASATSPMP